MRHVLTCARDVDNFWVDAFAQATDRLKRSLHGEVPSDAIDPCLKEILRQPDVVAPRLAYADALTASDDPRGEFIRLQCQLDRSLTNGPEFSELEAHEFTLFSRHGQTWSRPFFDRGVAACGFRRGFVEHIVIEASAFAAENDFLFRRAPIQSAEFCQIDSESIAADLAACSGLSRLTEVVVLDVRQDCSDQFLASEFLTNLQRLTLVGGFIMCLPLVELPWASQLTDLDLTQNLLRDGDVVALLEEPGMPNLVALNLRNNRFTDRFVGRLCEFRLPNLKRLDLSSNEMTDEALARLADSELELDHLAIGYNAITDDGVEAFANSRLAARLKSLDLSSTKLTHCGLRALAKAPGLAGLETLHLRRVPLEDDSLSELGRSERLPNLRTLSIHAEDWHAQRSAACALDERFGRRLDREFPLGLRYEFGRFLEYVRTNDAELHASFRGADAAAIAQLRELSWWGSLPELYLSYLGAMGVYDAGLATFEGPASSIFDMIDLFKEQRGDPHFAGYVPCLLPITRESIGGLQTCLRLDASPSTLPVYRVADLSRGQVSGRFLDFLYQRAQQLIASRRGKKIAPSG